MSLESPVSVLFDLEGQELALTASQSASFEDGTQSGLLVMGSGSTGAQFLSLTDNGALLVSGTVQATFDSNTPVSQGNPGGIGDAWYIRITDGTQVLGTGSSAPLWITGSVTVDNLVDVNVTNTVTITGTVDILNPVDVIVSGATFNGDNLLTELSGVTVANGALSVTGSITAVDVKCPATVVTGFDAATTNVTILAANSNRCGATFFMDGNSIAYIKLGAGAATNDYTVQLRNNAFFELPERYTGQVDVVFSNGAAGNTLYITEINES